jgi:hypothetical protein
LIYPFPSSRTSLDQRVPIGREIRFVYLDQTEVLATIEQEGRVSPREVRDQILQDRTSAVSVDEKSLFNRLPKPGHGVVLQEPQDSDKLPEPYSFLFLLPSKTTAR